MCTGTKDKLQVSRSGYRPGLEVASNQSQDVGEGTEKGDDCVCVGTQKTKHLGESGSSIVGGVGVTVVRVWV